MHDAEPKECTEPPAEPSAPAAPSEAASAAVTAATSAIFGSTRRRVRCIGPIWPLSMRTKSAAAAAAGHGARARVASRRSSSRIPSRPYYPRRGPDPYMGLAFRRSRRVLELFELRGSRVERPHPGDRQGVRPAARCGGEVVPGLPVAGILGCGPSQVGQTGPFVPDQDVPVAQVAQRLRRPGRPAMRPFRLRDDDLALVVRAAPARCAPARCSRSARRRRRLRQPQRARRSRFALFCPSGRAAVWLSPRAATTSAAPAKSARSVTAGTCQSQSTMQCTRYAT